MEVHEVKENKCPHCGESFNMVTGVYNDNPPEENDVSICSKCGNILRFDENIDLVIAEDEFLEEMKETHPEDYSDMMDVVIAIKARL